MEILKYKKMPRGKYKITTSSGEITLYEDVIIKNNFLLKKEIDLPFLEKILDENTYYEAYDLSLSYIETKLRTEKEISDYLEKKGFNYDVIKHAINKLKEIGLLNEKSYIEAYTNDKVNLSSYGPFKIKRDLLNLGLKEEDIDNYLFTIKDDVWSNKIDKVIKKRMSSLNGKSLHMIKNKLNIDLFNLGYDKDLISSKLNSLEYNDTDNMKKEMSKAYNKYSKNYEGEALKKQIKNHLYKKGFIVSDIDYE